MNYLNGQKNRLRSTKYCFICYEELYNLCSELYYMCCSVFYIFIILYHYQYRILVVTIICVLIDNKGLKHMHYDCTI